MRMPHYEPLRLDRPDLYTEEDDDDDHHLDFALPSAAQGRARVGWGHRSKKGGSPQRRVELDSSDEAASFMLVNPGIEDPFHLTETAPEVAGNDESSSTEEVK